MNFHSKILRVDCTRKFSLEASVVCDELQFRDIESVPENFPLKNQEFVMNFNSEISRVDCTRKFSLEASVVCDELQFRDISSVPENFLLKNQ